LLTAAALGQSRCVVLRAPPQRRRKHLVATNEWRQPALIASKPDE
jgi:hypothetical protein